MAIMNLINFQTIHSIFILQKNHTLKILDQKRIAIISKNQVLWIYLVLTKTFYVFLHFTKVEKMFWKLLCDLIVSKLNDRNSSFISWTCASLVNQWSMAGWFGRNFEGDKKECLQSLDFNELLVILI